jgi:HK97 family phage portal protein
MSLLSFWKKTEAKDASIETVLRMLVAAQGGVGAVTPDNCMRSPTVHALVTAISRRGASTPVHVYETSTKKGREVKEKLPNHPVAVLLRQPNEWQSRYDYFQDAFSTLVRHGRYIAKIGRGTTGPIRKLYPVNPSQVEIKQDESSLAISFKYHNQEWPFSSVHYARGPARDFVRGDSPVNDVQMNIALEIAATSFGASFFENGAVPLLILKYMQGSKGFKTPEAEKEFVDSFQASFSGNKRHRAFLVPPGIDVGDPIKIENDKAQFLQTRQHERTVIAGAWGVPPQFVGDLSSGKYNNVEQQSEDFTLNVVMPYTMTFESAMERDLLTPEERESGIRIRFNLDAELRAAFIDRQNGLQIQLEHGVITPNEWREMEGRPPREDADGDRYYQSVQTQNGAENNEPTTPNNDA